MNQVPTGSLKVSLNFIRTLVYIILGVPKAHADKQNENSKRHHYCQNVDDVFMMVEIQCKLTQE